MLEWIYRVNQRYINNMFSLIIQSVDFTIAHNYNECVALEIFIVVLE